MQKATALVFATATLLSACTSPTPYLDAHFGEAVTAAKAAQVVNPHASTNTDPVAGLDGLAASQSVERYHDSFKTPAQTFEVLGTAGGGNR